MLLWLFVAGKIQMTPVENWQEMIHLNKVSSFQLDKE